MAEGDHHVYSEVEVSQHFTFDAANHTSIGDLIGNTYEIIVPEDSGQTYEIHTLSDNTTVTSNASNIVFVNSDGDILEADDIQAEYQEETQYEEIGQSESQNLEESHEVTDTNEETTEKTSVSNEVVESIEAVVSQPEPAAGKNQVPIKCVLCKDEFANFSIFRDHLFDFHITGKLFKCKQCTKQFDYAQELKKHVTSHSGVKYFNCQYCSKGFLKRNVYEGHLLIHTGEQLPYHCVYCEHKFRLKETATLHIWRHQAETTVHVNCPDCDLSFYTELSMKHHSTGSRIRCNPDWKGKSYSCPFCSNISPKRIDFVNHFKTCHPEKYFMKIGDINACIKCGVIIEESEQELIDKHIKHHKVKDVFNVTCKTCGKTLRGKGAYTLHMKMHRKKQIISKNTSSTSNSKEIGAVIEDEVEEIDNETKIAKKKSEMNPKCYDMELKEFRCEHCPFKALMTKMGAENHNNAHSQDPPYECSRCHQSFPNITDWIYHNYQCFQGHHEGEIVCPACMTEVDTLRGLKIHMRMMHKDHLIFQMRVDNVNFLKCPICHKDFLTKSSLAFHKGRHKRLEKGKMKEYQCPYCPMKLSTSLTLLVHKRGHTGERPFMCRFCSKSFKDRTSLRSHSIVHTKNFRHFCEMCNPPKGFVTPFKMKIHIERTHLRGIKPPKPKTRKIKAANPKEAGVYVEGQFQTPF